MQFFLEIKNEDLQRWRKNLILSFLKQVAEEKALQLAKMEGVDVKTIKIEKRGEDIYVNYGIMKETTQNEFKKLAIKKKVIT